MKQIAWVALIVAVLCYSVYFIGYKHGIDYEEKLQNESYEVDFGRDSDWIDYTWDEVNVYFELAEVTGNKGIFKKGCYKP